MRCDGGGRSWPLDSARATPEFHALGSLRGGFPCHSRGKPLGRTLGRPVAPLLPRAVGAMRLCRGGAGQAMQNSFPSDTPQGAGPGAAVFLGGTTLLPGLRLCRCLGAAAEPGWSGALRRLRAAVGARRRGGGVGLLHPLCLRTMLLWAGRGVSHLG